MDVTFRESIPFYGEKTELSDLFLDPEPLDVGVIGGKENETAGSENVEESRKKEDVIINKKKKKRKKKKKKKTKKKKNKKKRKQKNKEKTAKNTGMGWAL